MRRLAAWIVICVFAGAAAADEVDFDARVRPILARYCFGCHGAKKQESGLRLDSLAAAAKGGDGGGRCSRRQRQEPDDPGNHRGRSGPGDAAQRRAPARMRSPCCGRWIDQSGVKASPDPLQTANSLVLPTHQAAVAAGRHGATRVRNPIDSFILSQLEQARIAPSVEADRRSLVRRLYLDVLGLPPSPEEAAAFIADGRPDAYERLVERALASRHFGERWARHWLDVVRFGETNGFEHSISAQRLALSRLCDRGLQR